MNWWLLLYLLIGTAVILGPIYAFAQVNERFRHELTDNWELTLAFLLPSIFLWFWAWILMADRNGRLGGGDDVEGTTDES